jgi:hypothetical protein
MKTLLLAIMLCGWATVASAATELTAQRTYNQDVFDLGNGQKNYKIHVAQINYKDTDGSFKKIDTAISANGFIGNWKSEKASYKSVLPEYADEWFEFYNGYEGANHTIKARPVCDHVKGEVFNGTSEGNFVLYKDAFGKGIDLKVYTYWAGLKKVIIINEKPADTKNDLTFDFELILPKRLESSEMKEAPIVDAKSATSWNKEKALDFTSKTLKIGFDDKCSYFRDAKVWDSGELKQSVDISLYTKDGKIYLRKTIKADILEKAVYPLFTDHPTNYSVGVGDGVVSGSLNGSWDTVHNATTGTADYGFGNSPPGFLANTQYIPVPLYNVYRGFIPIDTSGIDDGATISSAKIYFYANSKNGSGAIGVVQSSQASTSSLTGDDFDNCGSVHSPTEGATRVNVADITTSQYNYISLNSTGIGWIDKTGFTKLGFRESRDLDDTTPTGQTNYVTFNGSETTGPSTDPYLEVTVAGDSNNTTPRQSIGQGIGVGIGSGI